MDFDDLKVGDEIIILNKPPMWSSRFSNKDPREHLTFPHIGVIDKLKYDYNGDEKGLTCLIDGYGFFLMRDNVILQKPEPETPPLSEELTNTKLAKFINYE